MRSTCIFLLLRGIHPHDFIITSVCWGTCRLHTNKISKLFFFSGSGPNEIFLILLPNPQSWITSPQLFLERERCLHWFIYFVSCQSPTRRFVNQTPKTFPLPIHYISLYFYLKESYIFEELWQFFLVGIFDSQPYSQRPLLVKFVMFQFIRTAVSYTGWPVLADLGHEAWDVKLDLVRVVPRVPRRRTRRQFRLSLPLIATTQASSN